MVGVFSLVLLLWVSGEWHGISATTIACVGLALLLLTRVLEWQDVLDEKAAWDALIWFGGLMMLAAQLDKAGLSQGIRRRGRRSRRRLAVVAGALGARRRLRLLALRIRQPGGARHGDVSGVFCGRRSDSAPLHSLPPSRWASSPPSMRR